MKCFALIGLILFIGVAVTPSINANIKNNKEAETADTSDKELNEQQLIEPFKEIINYCEAGYGQKLTTEDNCGCEEEPQRLRWGFPIFCTLLFPYFFFFAMMGYAGFYMALLILGFANAIGCYWAIPPNRPPDISPVEPLNGEIDVLLSLDELRFQISDDDKDRMSYTVTTDPDIGSGSGVLKLDGVYSISVSGLEGSTEYHWYVEASDGEDTSVSHYTFTTAPNEPIVSNPIPFDGARNILIDAVELSFHVMDFQGDLMDYSVETVPDIGSGSGIEVDEGIYYVPINNLDYSVIYTWFVNVTDGTYQTHKVYSFQAEHKTIFDPFMDGWQYRKKISINHTQIEGDLEYFPVLLSTYDSDLRDKAQPDGDDLLFMDGYGIANRLYHEIEYFDASNGKLVTWINVTSVSSSQDSEFIMYYGNPSCNNQESPELVWDSHYKAVWHMSDDTSSTIRDSAGVNTGTKTGNSGNMPDERSGKIGNAQEFDGANIERIIFSHCPYPVGADDDLTVSIWSKTPGGKCWIILYNESIRGVWI
jgi:hypothetical protein